jgi:polysaccharide export outer membrane protein
MRLRHLRSLLVAAFFLFPTGLAAQTPTTRPTPEQAQILLQTRPDLVAQLRQRMAASGMTPEQIRARLRAEGYPENLLDSYMSTSTGDASPPTATVFSAVRDLGIADSTEMLGGQAASERSRAADTDVLNRIDSRYRPDTLQGAARDSVIRLMTNRDSGFVIFGLDVFRNSTNQFQPNLAGPIDANYRLGPGDRLVLILTGDVESSYTLDVTREGFVVIPQVGQIFVNNLTLGDLEVLLASRLSRVYSGVRRDGTGSTRFSVSVAKLRTNQVFVVGDVLHPNSYSISSAGTALTALYAAGGPSINGSLRRIEVRRGGRVVDVLDVYDYLIRGDASHDVRLQTGDIVFVPVHGARARVVGEVIRPATYEAKPGEGIPQLIEAAGGYTATAAQRRILVERIVPADQRSIPGRDRTTIDVSAQSLASAAIPVQNGDVVRVFPITERVRNRITVLGNVNTPGAQGLAPAMKLSDALRGAGGVKPDTYLNEVLITRLLNDSTRVQLRSRLADTSGTPVDDLPLREDDQIQVFSVTSFRPVRYVAIVGHVNKPGRFLYREGMTLRDLVLLGGGVKEGASLREAEVARLPADRSAGQTAVTLRVPLDSTYLFERASGRPYVGPPGVPAPAGGAPEFTLDPYDNVLILRQASFEYQRTVTLNGEVRFPGSYALKSKREHLAELIARAGGLTDEAQIDAIVFVRKGPATYALTNTKDGDVSSTLVQDSLTRARATNGRIGLDLASALRDQGSRDNIVLEDGDEITILRYNPVVRVQGAVNAPANVTFVPGRDLYYYIRAAGGGSRLADQRRAYVTQPSGKLESVRTRPFFPDAVPVPQAGAVVTVPDRDPADRFDYAAVAAVASQIIASLVAIIAIVRR